LRVETNNESIDIINQDIIYQLIIDLQKTFFLLDRGRE